MMENTISRFSVSRRLAGVCSRIYSNNRRITRSRVLLLFLLRLVVPVSCGFSSSRSRQLETLWGTDGDFARRRTGQLE